MSSQATSPSSRGRKRRRALSFATPTITPKEIYARLSARVVGQEEAKKALALGVYKHFERVRLAMSGIRLGKENILLIGPTGTGKTLMVQALAEMLAIPFSTTDATTLSATGYVGDDVESILLRLLIAAGGDIITASTGIAFVDEIDKITRSRDRGDLDVSGKGVQRGLLRMMEGGFVSIDPLHRNKHPSAEMIELETSNVLFICAGAFEGLEDLIRRRIGTSRTSQWLLSGSNEAPSNDELRRSVTAEDLISFGFLPEFAGRFGSIGVLSSLGKAALIQILKSPRNGIFVEMQHYFKAIGIELIFDDDAVEMIAERATSGAAGARSLRALVSDSLRDTLFELPGRSDVSKCIVHKGVVLSGEPPLLIGYTGEQVVF